MHLQMIELIRGYMVEAKWLNAGYMPTTDEHESVASVTIGGGVAW